MKLTPRLIILFLAVALVPVLLASVLAYLTTSREITARVISDMGLVADRRKEELEVILASHDATTTTFSTTYDLRSNLDNHLKNKNARNSITALNHTLRTLKANALDVTEISVIDPADTVQASTETSRVGTKFDTKAVLKDSSKAVTIGKDAEGNIRLYFWNRLSFDGRDLGTLRTSFNAFAINGVLQDYTGLGDTGQTLLVSFDAGKAQAVAPIRFDKSAAFTLSLPDSPLLAKNDATYNDVQDYRGERVVSATRYLASTDWLIITTINTGEVFQPIYTLGNTLIIVAVATSVLIVLAALYFARQFTTPIIELTQKTREIVRGKLNQSIPVTSSDEIGILAASFNNMTAKLRELYRGLEQKVTERTQALNQKVDELAAAKAKDEAIINNMGEGLVVTDTAGHVLLMNPVAESILGVPPGSYAGKIFNTVAPLKEDDGTPFLFENSVPTLGIGRQIRMTHNLSLAQKDGSKSAITMTVTPIVSGEQRIGAISILRDSTKEKEIDRMKTEFISLASHQLRTPLSAIKWFTEMLVAGDAGELNKDQAQFAENIAGANQRMIDLVSSLLNISRIESGRIIIEPKPTDLNKLLNGIVTDLKGKIEERKQHLIVSVHEGLPPINLDPDLIGQVYLNLLTNAIKYTPKEGEITVMVSRAGDQLISQVSDNGYGIPKSEQPRMFQKFFRASNIIKVEADGTGLGMYLIKAIVESSGGKIWFKSEEGKGTTFWFSLPMTGMKAKAGEVRIGA